MGYKGEILNSFMFLLQLEEKIKCLEEELHETKIEQNKNLEQKVKILCDE